MWKAQRSLTFHNKKAVFCGDIHNHLRRPKWIHSFLSIPLRLHGCGRATFSSSCQSIGSTSCVGVTRLRRSGFTCPVSHTSRAGSPNNGEPSAILAMTPSFVSLTITFHPAAVRRRCVGTVKRSVRRFDTYLRCCVMLASWQRTRSPTLSKRSFAASMTTCITTEGCRQTRVPSACASYEHFFLRHLVPIQSN